MRRTFFVLFFATYYLGYTIYYCYIFLFLKKVRLFLYNGSFVDG